MISDKRLQELKQRVTTRYTKSDSSLRRVSPIEVLELIESVEELKQLIRECARSTNGFEMISWVNAASRRIEK